MVSPTEAEPSSSSIGASVAKPVATGASFTAANVTVTSTSDDGRTPSEAVTLKDLGPFSSAAGT